MGVTGEVEESTAGAVDRIADVLAGRRIAVLTGAGVSTDSGIPDYRGKGAPKRTPMTISTFLGSNDARARYWLGGQLGWSRFSAAEPNAGHRALAQLESQGIASGIVTQNVDGLHLRAGSERVVEVHGTMRRVLCTVCGQIFDRRDLSQRIVADNPWVADISSIELGPDGDVTPESSAEFTVPACSVCGGVLRPDVVFFGEYIPVERFREAESIVSDATALLVAGSSLVVNSGIRLVERARRRKLPIVIVNRGETRADGHATVKVDSGTSDVLSALADRLVS